MNTQMNGASIVELFFNKVFILFGLQGEGKESQRTGASSVDLRFCFCFKCFLSFFLVFRAWAENMNT